MDKQSFLNARVKPLAVDVPEWGDTVYIRKISAADRVKFMRDMQIGEGEKSKILIDIAKFLQLVICDQDSTRIFDDSEDDFQLLASKESEILDRLFDVAWEFNGIGENSAKAALKNSGTSQS